MTRYDNLDARAELEQRITQDLKQALEKRGFQVKHNGSNEYCASGGLPDIEIWDDRNHINVEVTKTVKSSSDREFLSITDHLKNTKENNSAKKCFTLYVSPETHYRMLNATREYNLTRKEEPDMKILPLSFYTFEVFVNKLISSIRDEYTKRDILALFQEYLNFVDDDRIAILLQEKLFSSDTELKKEIEKREENSHQKRVESLIKDFSKLEQDLRDYRIALSTDAIRNVILLVFIKLYEEKREHEGKENRFTLTSFTRFQAYEGQEETKKAIHILFEKIKSDSELKACKLFTPSDSLAERLDDDFIIEFFIKPFSKYHFYTTKIDGLGAAYEVLGKLSGKDVKVGQFFTPENVVNFMVRLAELEYNDVVLDPACGTGRFLIYAMPDMLNKVSGRDQDAKKLNIRKNQLVGTDNDQNVSKLAKMNMYIHGDGKTNIFDEDGLLFNRFDGKVDVILTNPPLGDLSFNLNTYDDSFRLERMQVIPKKNLTEEKIEEYKKKIEELKELRAANSNKRARYEASISKFEDKLRDETVKLNSERADFKVGGSYLKGGALFVNAAYHYLKPERNSSALPEWRGGKLLIVLDEGILNTDDYKDVRKFIRKNFYIKAVISLTKDAFVPVSNTTTKTSILYAIRKGDPDAVQQEPIFFAHVEKVGLDTRKKVCPNHLINGSDDILIRYMDFKEKVLDSYEGLKFNKQKFLQKGFSAGSIA